MSAVKDLLLKVKALFEAPDEVVITSAPTPFKLKDGTGITIAITDPAVSMIPVAGEVVTIAEAPAAAGDYELEDGTKITVGEAGAITVVTPPEPITQSPEEIEAARVAAQAPVVLTAESVQAMYAKFATGTPEERLANIEVMIKALMEYNFGYEIRKGQDAAAIQAYKDSLATTQQTVVAQTSQIQAATVRMEKQDEVIKGLFELAEKLVEMPTAEPVTLTGNKKERFEKQKSKEDKFDKMGAALKELRNKNKNPASV